jgi:protein-tyrosine phosphatase
MHAEVQSLRAAADVAGLELEILPGAEIALSRLGSLSPEDRAGFGLGGNTGLLLLEFPYTGWPLGLEDAVFRLRSAGIVPVLAHPERNPDVQANPALLERAVRGGAYVQLTAASVDGRLGSRPQRCSTRLLELGFAHVLASDAHAPSVRAAGLGRAAELLGAVGRWMTVDVPRALLAGSDPPPRPVLGRRRRWLGRR